MVEIGGAPVAGDIYYGVSTRLFVFYTIPPVSALSRSSFGMTKPRVSRSELRMSAPVPISLRETF